MAVPPEFAASLEDFTIFFGDPLTYKLPPASSPEGYEVTISTSIKEFKWLKFTASSGTYKIEEGATTFEDIGGYAIQIVLTDSKGTKSYFNFYIFIEDDPSRYNTGEDKSALAPWPDISISRRGLLTIEWDKRIKVPRNLQETRNSTVQYFDPITQKPFQKESLEITIRPGKDQQFKDVNFTWDYVSWKS